MSKMKKLAFALLLAVPMVASAAGMGVYVPFSVGDTVSVTNTVDNYDIDYDTTNNMKSAVGIGLVFDSNLGKDKLFNYRVGLEYQSQSVDTGSFESGPEYSCNDSFCDYSRINLVQTFGFGVLRTQTVRLWVGPRINLAMNYQSTDYDTGYYTNTYSEASFEIGIAPAVGVNVNLGRLVTLAFDVDYRFAGIVGAWDDGENFSGTYSGGAKGATARFSVLFRFGETFQPASAQTQDQGVVDQSL